MPDATPMHVLARGENRGVTYRQCADPLDALIHLKHRTASNRVVIDCAMAISPQIIGAAGFSTRPEDGEIVYIKPDSPTELAKYLMGIEEMSRKADSPDPCVVLIYEPRHLLGDDWRQKFRFGTSGILSIVFAYENADP